jgi:hypothetical protein
MSVRRPAGIVRLMALLAAVGLGVLGCPSAANRDQGVEPGDG